MHYENHLTQAAAHLRAARADLLAEISSYPTPISGCDAQFNHLISDRQKVTEMLQVLQSQPFVPTPRAPDPGDRVESR